MSAPRVLTVIPSIGPAYGGTSSAVISLVRAIRADGIDASILTTDANGSSRIDARIGEWTSYEGAPVLVFEHVFHGSRVFSAGLFRWLYTHAAEFDLLHLHAVFSLVTSVASRVATLKGVPYVLTPHGMLGSECLQQRRLAKALYLEAVEKRTIRRASVVHALTEEEAICLSAYRPMRTEICPSGVTPQSALGGPVSAEPSRDVSRPSEHRIVYVGRLDPIKNIELLIQAFHRLADASGGCALVIAGGGSPDYTARLQLLAREGTGGGSVVFAGRLSGAAVQALLRSAAVVVVPSHSEGLSMALLEALAAGAPTVVTEAAAPAVIRNSGAVCVTPNEPDALAAILSQLVRDCRLRSALSARARVLIGQEFATSVVARQMRAIYSSVLTTPVAVQE